MHNKFVVQISRSKAYRAKRRALDLVEGSHKEQYVSLWDYYNELKRSNPGNTIMVQVVGYEVGDAQAENTQIHKYRRIQLSRGSMCALMHVKKDLLLVDL